MEGKKVTFEDIQKANETIKTMEIERKDKKGNTIVKEYAEVNQRIKAFRMVYPRGTIETQIVSNENGICIFKASVTDEAGDLLATGTAYEKENSTFINQMSYIENCETSAVGRALGMAGFGIDTSIASAEEITNATTNKKDDDQKVKLKATPTQVAQLLQVYKGNSLKKLLETNEITKIEDMPLEKASELIKKIQEKGNK